MDETPVAAADAARHPLNAQQAEELVIATITRHADAVLRTARRHSLCASDAHETYQRGGWRLAPDAHGCFTPESGDDESLGADACWSSFPTVI